MKYFKLFENFNRTVKELDNLYDYFHISWDRFNINSDGKTFTFHLYTESTRNTLWL